MGSDRSLDEFVSTDHKTQRTEGATKKDERLAENKAESTSDKSRQESVGVATRPSSNEADTATVSQLNENEAVTGVSLWIATGRPCEQCESKTNRLWTTNGRLVCADCKSWEESLS